MAELQAKAQSLSDEFTKLQQGMEPHFLFEISLLTSALDLQTAVQARQKLEAQKQENLGVQKVCLQLMMPSQQPADDT
jgi:prefoldin beta subunit